MRFLSLAWVCSVVSTLGASEIENLGRQLFFDKRLSVDGTLNCGMCHRPDKAFADPNPVSTGIGGAIGKFNAPSVLNLQNAKLFFWNGRSTSLEQQAEGPLLNPLEMGNTKQELEDRLALIPEYQIRFRRSFGDSRVTLDRITRALAAYERTLKSTHSLYDDWRFGHREHWSPEHEFGRQLFFGEAGCAKCHSGSNFTNHELVPSASGNFYKVPSLREVIRTAPYMHDGSIPTLKDVLNRHQGAAKLHDLEKHALLRFLESLSGDYSR